MLIKFKYSSFGAFDRIQTFSVGKDAVAGAAKVMLTSVDLYFRRKPHRGFKTVLGVVDPGVRVAICEIKDDIPDINSVITKSIKNVPYGLVNTGGVATNVAFDEPLLIDTDKDYGILVDTDGLYDETDDLGVFIQSLFHGHYKLEENRKGEYLIKNGVVSNVASNGPKSAFRGRLFGWHTDRFCKPFHGRSLKFSVYIAKYNSGSDGDTSGSGNDGSGGNNGTDGGNSSSNTAPPAGTQVTASFNLVNKPYEFLSVTERTGSFTGGEWVYVNKADEPGTITLEQGSDLVIGTGTNFTNNHLGMYLVANYGSETKVFKITSVANTTAMTIEYGAPLQGLNLTYKIPPIGTVYYQNALENVLILDDSNAANNTFKFSANDVIIGHLSKASTRIASVNRYPLDAFNTNFAIGTPATSNIRVKYALTGNDNTIQPLNDLSANTKVQLPYEGFVLSRSLEVLESGLYSTSKKSAYANVTFNIISGGANTYLVPFIDTSVLNFEMEQNDINNTTLATRNGITDYDTEVDKNGIGRSKYISEKISFNEDKFAEDVLAYVTAFRPAGTEIKVYAKIHNSADREAFDDKGWTPLVMRSNSDKYSGEDSKNLVEYSFGLPPFPEVDKKLSGAFFSVNASDTISTTVDQQTQIEAGDLIKLTSPLFEKNNEVFVVKAVSGATITLTRPVSNANIVGEVRVEKLKYKKTAWNNAGNYGISRYVNEAGVEFDYYNTLQIKVVLLAEKSWIIPRVEQLQVIGASV